MGGHIGVAAIDHGIEQARLDHRDLGIVGHQQLRHPAEEGEGRDVGVDPVGQRLGPGRKREAEGLSRPSPRRRYAPRGSRRSRDTITGTLSPA